MLLLQYFPRTVITGFLSGSLALVSAQTAPTKPAANGTQIAPLVTPAAAIAPTSSSAVAKPAAGSPADLAHKIWLFTNGDKTLAQLKNGLSGGDSQLSISIDKPMAEKINGVLGQAFDPIPGLFEEHIARTGKPEQLAEIVKWLDSPFGKKVREAESKAPPLQYNELERTIPLKAPNFSKEREQLYKRYDKVAYASTARMITETVEFYLVVNNGIKPPTERTAPKELDQAVKLSRARMDGLTQQLLPHLFASTYRDMIVDELGIYIKFLETDAGQAYLRLTSDAYVAALKQVRPAVLLRLADIFDDELAVLSPYSKEVLSPQKQRQLLQTMIKRYGKPPLIGAILEIRGGQITIIRHGAQQEMFGRPSQDLVTIDTILKDLAVAKVDLRRYYQTVQKRIKSGN